MSVTAPASGTVVDSSVATGSVVVTDPRFGAKGDGVTDDAPAFTAAISFMNAAGGGLVLVPPPQVSYRFGEPVSMLSNVSLTGLGNPKITQANGQNLSNFIQFGTASNAYVSGLYMDGNRANNTNDLTHTMIHLQGGVDVGATDNTLVNCPGYSIASNALRAKILRNRVSNPYGTFGIFNAAPGNTYSTAAYLKLQDNYCDGLCLGGVILGSSDYADVSGNTFVGVQIGGRGNRLTVNTSGTTVTWSSGPNFASIQPGMFLVIDGGQEYQVASLQSNTSLTVTATMPTLTNTPASIGTGDIIGVVNSSFAKISRNTLSGGVTFGIGLSLGGVSWGTAHNLIVENHLDNCGKNGINISYDSGSGFLFNNSVIGNFVYNAGSSPGAAAADMNAIYLFGQFKGKVENTFIDGNTCLTDSGDGQQPYWLGTDGNIDWGNVRIGSNAATGFVKQGILNDVGTVSLGAGWGSSASVSGVVSTGRSVQLTVTANGSGITANPVITISKICVPAEQAVLVASKIQALSGGGTLSFMYGEQASSPSSWTATYSGTPSAGASYTLLFQG